MRRPKRAFKQSDERLDSSPFIENPQNANSLGNFYGAGFFPNARNLPASIAPDFSTRRKEISASKKSKKTSDISAPNSAYGALILKMRTSALPNRPEAAFGMHEKYEPQGPGPCYKHRADSAPKSHPIKAGLSQKTTPPPALTLTDTKNPNPIRANSKQTILRHPFK